MRGRLSARVLLTSLMTALSVLAVILIVDVVRQSLADAYPGAIPESTSAVWTIGILLIAATALVAWTLSGYMLAPLRQLRRDLRLAARIRALSEPHPGELAEIQALRGALISVLEELDARTRSSESEQYRVLGLFESITEGIVQVSPDARLMHVNAAARALLGLPVNAEGKLASSLIRNIDLREIIERSARGEAMPGTEVVIEGRQLLVSPQPLRGGHEQAGSTVISVVDLTELRRLETVRRDFVANVSHELKTPLTAIRGYAETILAEDVPRDLELQFLNVIHRNATRLQRVVDELLDLSRLQSGGWQPMLQRVEVQSLAQDVWSAFEENARRKCIDFEIAGAPATACADPDGLRQVLSNLYDNAIRYTPEGGRVRTLVHQAGAGGAARKLEIEVRDTGIGIPSDALPRIFERFFRVDPARSREQGGTGLGLSIVKHLIERMGGEVVAESELGKGTSIKVRLPEIVENV
ncbi:MAG: sensor histidine kinase [Gemmatimonadota bacterium]